MQAVIENISTSLSAVESCIMSCFLLHCTCICIDTMIANKSYQKRGSLGSKYSFSVNLSLHCSWKYQQKIHLQESCMKIKISSYLYNIRIINLSIYMYVWRFVAFNLYSFNKFHWFFWRTREAFTHVTKLLTDDLYAKLEK